MVNWTLSDPKQRKKLKVNVAYNSDLEKVLEILKTVSANHPEVLDDPEPIATFDGFGEYSLEFTLYYWITKNIFQTKTEIALAVFKALKEANIEIPYPVQKIYLKKEEKSAQDGAANDMGEKE